MIDLFSALDFEHLKEEKPDGVVNESIQQVAFADRIILNKVAGWHKLPSFA